MSQLVQEADARSNPKQWLVKQLALLVAETERLRALSVGRAAELATDADLVRRSAEMHVEKLAHARAASASRQARYLGSRQAASGTTEARQLEAALADAAAAERMARAHERSILGTMERSVIIDQRIQAGRKARRKLSRRRRKRAERNVRMEEQCLRRCHAMADAAKLALAAQVRDIDERGRNARFNRRTREAMDHRRALEKLAPFERFVLRSTGASILKSRESMRHQDQMAMTWSARHGSGAGLGPVEPPAAARATHPSPLMRSGSTSLQALQLEGRVAPMPSLASLGGTDPPEADGVSEDAVVASAVSSIMRGSRHTPQFMASHALMSPVKTGSSWRRVRPVWVHGRSASRRLDDALARISDGGGKSSH